MVKVHSVTRLYGALAQNRFDAGDTSAADRYLQNGFRIQRAVGECVPCDVLLYPAAVPLYITQGKLEEADHACTQLENTANAFGSRAWIATARHMRGILLGESQEWERSKALLRDAITIYRELEQPYEIAQVAQALGEVILRGTGSRDDEDPQALLKEAHAIYARLGSTVRRDQLGQLLQDVVI